MTADDSLYESNYATGIIEIDYELLSPDDWLAIYEEQHYSELEEKANG